MNCIWDTFLKTFLITSLLLVFSRNVAGQVFELTLQNFDQYTKDKDVMLVEFFAPWCHHCQAFAPEYEKAAAALAVNREYILGRADCFGTGKELCDRFHVQMYPMVKLFRHGVYQEDFEGDRTADAVIRYLQQAQSQPGTARAPDGGSQPNADPWQTGASFQYAYPMTTPSMSQPVQTFQQVQQPQIQQPQIQQPQIQVYPPTPELQQVLPNVERAETRPQPAPQVQNGNFWFNNNLWNRLKPQQPSIFTPIVTHQPAPPQYAVAPQQQMIRAAPEMPQRAEASTSLEYNSRDNTPFQAQTSTSQTSFTPPSASIAVPATPITGAYQGEMNTQNNQLGTSVIFIEGRPYAIRRIVNRYSNHHYPINLNSFLPNARFAPGFLRGDKIPRVVNPFAPKNNNPVRAAPPKQMIPQRPPFVRIQPPPQQKFGPRQQVLRVQMQSRRIPVVRNNVPTQSKVSQRYDVTRPTYFQMFSNFLQGKKPPTFETGKVRMAVTNWQNLPNYLQRRYPTAQPTQAAMNRIFETYKRKLTNELERQLPYGQKAQERTPFSAQNNARGPSRYVISIRGQPGSKAVAAIKNKAMRTPGFLSNLLNGGSYLTSRRQQIQRQKQQQQQAQRRQQLLRQKQVKRIKIQSPALVNVPQTDRALIRAKVLRPDLMARAKWAAKGAKTGTTRGNIVYVPRSAFARLPPWYRPKLGPALVKYVVKTDDVRKSFPMLAQANKKQALARPAPGNLWHKIYNFYNRRNELQMRDAPYRPKFTPSPLAVRQPNVKFNLKKPPVLKPVNIPASLQKYYVNNLRKPPALKPVNIPASLQKYYVNKPQFRVRNNPVKPELQQKPKINNFYNKVNFLMAKRYPANTRGPMANNYNKINTAMMNTKEIPPELWDKRSIVKTINKKSYIPRRPMRFGNWGTLKKKRSASAGKRRHHKKTLRRHRRFLSRKMKNAKSRKHSKRQSVIRFEDDN